MDTAALTAAHTPARRDGPADERARALPTAYAAAWLVTATVAAATVPFATGVRAFLGLRLAHHAGRVDELPGLLANNLRVAWLPILLATLQPHRHTLIRRGGDLVLASVLTVNVALGGMALGAYGPRILPYLPHLPAEWAGLAIGAAAWLIARRRMVSRGALLLFALAATGLLLLAALLETFAVP